jgi:hypothetical protein
LRDVGLRFDEVHLAPPKGTLEFKKGLLTKLLQRYPFIDTVRIWDDRKSHLPAFYKAVVQAGIAPENIHINQVRAQSREPECGEEEFEASAPGKPSYIAAFLSSGSKSRLAHDFPYKHHKAKADHMTISRKVTPDLLALVGRPVSMKVIGYAESDRIQAVVVAPTPDLGGDRRISHITLSHEEGVPASEANDLLAAGWEPVDGPTLSGIVDVFPRSLTMSRRVALQVFWGVR